MSTPNKDKREVILEFHSSPDAILNALHQAGWQIIPKEERVELQELHSAEALARFFHDTYEMLAPSFGYETRPETREFVPQSKNGRLMVTVCEGVLVRVNAALKAEREKRQQEQEMTNRLGSQLLQAQAAIEIEYDLSALREHDAELQENWLRSQPSLSTHCKGAIKPLVEALKKAEKDLRLAFNTDKESYGYSSGLDAVVSALASVKETS